MSGRQYVDRIDIGGTVGYVKETITGHGAPTKEMVGFIGQRYVDLDNGWGYMCDAIDAQNGYIWKRTAGTATRTLALTYDDGTVEIMEVFLA